MVDRPIFKFITADGKLDADNMASIEDLKKLLKSPTAKVLLYLHGGLVNREAGLQCADKLSARGSTSLDLEDDWIQIYIVWQTGALEEIERHWTDLVRNDGLYLSIVRKLISFLSARLIVSPQQSRSLAAAVPLSDTEILKRLRGETDHKRAPFAALDDRLEQPAGMKARATVGGRKSPDRLAGEFNQFLATDPLFKKAVADLGAAVNRDAPSRAAGTPGTALEGDALFVRLSDEVKTDLIGNLDATALTAEAGAARGPATISAFLFGHTFNIARNCIERFRHERDHGLHATIVEEVCRELYGATIGATIWGWMTRDAQRHFEAKGFGRELLSAIVAAPTSRLVVIGHSAGSIWASRLLLAMAEAKSQLRIDLCLLAPAVRVSLFAMALQSARQLIGRCEMFTMDDGLERADAVLGHDKGYIYPSSLLYLVSGLFERENDEAYRDAPILGMERFTAGKWMTPNETMNAEALTAFFAEDGNSIHYSKGSGLTASDSHGGFDDDPLTLKNINARFFAS